MAHKYSARELIDFSKAAITDSRLPSLSPTTLCDFHIAGKKGLNHPGYTDKMIALKDTLAEQGYNDPLNYQTYRAGFVAMLRGEAVQTRIDVATNAVNAIADMDQPTLARFGFFLFREDAREFNFLGKRAADGTLHAVLERANALGPNRPVAPANEAQPKPVAA